jgi:hypothetical protein
MITLFSSSRNHLSRWLLRKSYYLYLHGHHHGR